MYWVSVKNPEVIVIDPARILSTNKKAMKSWKEKTQGEQGAQTETGKNKRERWRNGRGKWMDWKSKRSNDFKTKEAFKNLAIRTQIPWRIILEIQKMEL
jgi:lysozyme family protein